VRLLCFQIDPLRSREGGAMPDREAAERRLRKLTEAENGLRDLGGDFIDPSDAPRNGSALSSP
jgi:hypothetical protein